MTEETNVDVYQLFERMSRAIGFLLVEKGIGEIQVPEDFVDAVVADGHRQRIDARAWQDEKLAMGRIVRVDGGEELQIMNMLFLPPSTSPLPIFHCDILALRQGIQLFILDLYPTKANEITTQLRKRLMESRAQTGGRFTLEDRPTWGEKVFSKEAIILRPEDGTRLAQIAELVLMLEALFEPWLEALVSAEADRSEKEEAMILRRKLHLLTHAQHAPIGPYLAKLADEHWLRRLLTELLFPLWLMDGDAPAPWLSRSLMERSVH